MTETDGNIQAYRVMAEVLISFRKIVLRGLIKQSGENWHVDGCPPHVTRRLMERKETELAIQRLTVEDQDLMSFATFGDLAEILEHNDDLARLLKNLAPSKEILCARLIELESLRAKLAMAREMSGDEISVLSNYSLNLRQLLAGARQRRSQRRSDAVRPTIKSTPMSELPPPPPVEPVRIEPPERVEEPSAVVVEEPEPSLGEDTSTVVIDAPPPEPDGEPEEHGAEATAGPSEADETAPAEAAPEADTAAEPEPEPAAGPSAREGDDSEEREAAESGDAEPAEGFGGDEPSDAGVLEAEAASEPLPRRSLVTVDFEALAEEVSEALEEDDAKAVLRLLRREIIAVSESVYRLDDQIETVAWDRVTAGEWFQRHESELELAPIGAFYELIDEFKTSRARGDDRKVLRSFLSDRGFSKLLLTLREVFLRNGI